MDVIKMITPKAEPGVFAMPEMDVSGLKRKYLDVPYCINAGKNQTMDIYLPDEGDGPFPVIIFIHGGAFWGGDKRSFQPMYVMDGVRRGYAVVSMNYRLIDEAKFPLPVYDVKAAVRFLRANAGAYKLDAKHFGTCGDSAGGYFSTLLGTSGNVAALEDQSMGSPWEDTSIQAAVGLFGVYDLPMQSQFTEDSVPVNGAPKLANFADLFMGLCCRENPQLCALAYPGSYVTKDCAPTLIQAGTSDEIVPYQNSPDLVERINAVCGEGRAIMEPFPGCTHGHADFGKIENVDRLFRFYDEHLK